MATGHTKRGNRAAGECGVMAWPDCLRTAFTLMCDAMTSADLTDEMNYGTENYY